MNQLQNWCVTLQLKLDENNDEWQKIVENIGRNATRKRKSVKGKTFLKKNTKNVKTNNLKSFVP